MGKHRQKLLPPLSFTSLFAALAVGMLLAGARLEAGGKTKPKSSGPTERVTRSDVHEVVRRVFSKQDELIVVPGPRPKTHTPSQWFTNALKAENKLTAEEETWLLFRSMQVNDKDSMHIERVDKKGDAFVVTMSRYTWLGPYYRNVTFHEVHGVTLGKLPAGKYSVTWIIRDAAFTELAEGGLPKTLEKAATPVELKMSFSVGAP